MDALKKGEFFDDAFTEHRGLGDRDNNRYILPKFPKFGEEAGDRVVYSMTPQNFRCRHFQRVNVILSLYLSVQAESSWTF